ncbi:hypothetical protein ACIQ2D_16030 [Lysinibacillus sp. NPDC097287]|uniref:hypothetical protein n=1 Tax=Lysinibacillus sp. NPDC097287 TaxID=3364144 RepID=UPI00380B3CA9
MGISEQLETPQERSETVFCDESEATGVNEEAPGSPPGSSCSARKRSVSGKAFACSGMCCQVQILVTDFARANLNFEKEMDNYAINEFKNKDENN